MKVILQKDVKNLGQVGDIVSVKKGYARYFLFPKKLAMIFTKGRQAEANHRQVVIESKKKKALQERQSLADKLKDINLSFLKEADGKGQLFGSVNAFEISKQLEEKGFYVDKKCVKLSAPLKEVGTHKVLLQWSSELKTNIQIMIKSTHLTGEKKSVETNKKSIEEVSKS